MDCVYMVEHRHTIWSREEEKVIIISEQGRKHLWTTGT